MFPIFWHSFLDYFIALLESANTNIQSLKTFIDGIKLNLDTAGKRYKYILIVSRSSKGENGLKIYS